MLRRDLLPRTMSDVARSYCFSSHIRERSRKASSEHVPEKRLEEEAAVAQPFLQPSFRNGPNDAAPRCPNRTGDFEGWKALDTPWLNQLFQCCSSPGGSVVKGISVDTGRMTMNVEPRPGPGLVACTEPPWISTRLRTIASPNPMPR